MYEIAVEGYFDAAHFLRGYKGKCEALHGHRYRAVARVSTPEVDDIGLAYDFTELKRHLNDILSKFDHTCLNDVPPFDKMNPSSENIAANIYSELKPKLSGAPISLSAIEIWESPHTRVTYTPD
jgi:6-pyruvoyltetrahydropterin/6-carboxytetrahydropterin synthase